MHVVKEEIGGNGTIGCFRCIGCTFRYLVGDIGSVAREGKWPLYPRGDHEELIARTWCKNQKNMHIRWRQGHDMGMTQEKSDMLKELGMRSPRRGHVC